MRGSRAVRGFTLVELVVVLAVLATLAAAAVLSTEGLVDQTRYETTRSTLGEVEAALVGRHGLVTPQGQPWIRGFVADVGRLPKAVGADPDTQLAELWIAPADVEPFGVQTAEGDAEVRLSCGWRGPYLRLPLGASDVLDGWGRPFELRTASGLPALDGDLVAAFRTLGADGLPGGLDHDEDLELVLQSDVVPLVAAQHLGDVPVRVTGDSASLAAHVVVRLYGPEDGEARTLDQLTATGGASTGFSFTDVSVGVRVLRVYLSDVDPVTLGEQDDVRDWDPAVIAGEILPLVVVSGGLPEIVVTFD